MLEFLRKMYYYVITITKEGRINILLKNPIYKLKKILKTFLVIIKLKNFPQEYSVKYLMKFIFQSSMDIIRPRQISGEISELLNLICKENVKYMLEIGTANGGTLFLYSRVVSKEGILISVDLPGGSHGGGYSEWRIPVIKRFSLPKQKLHLIRGNSHNQSTLKKVKSLLGGNKLDFLFIDGDHSYNGVKRDFKMYSPLVKNKGIIAFHDIVIHPPHLKINVNKFWNEVKTQFNYKEIIENKNQNWAGIGVLIK